MTSGESSLVWMARHASNRRFFVVDEMSRMLQNRSNAHFLVDWSIFDKKGCFGLELKTSFHASIAGNVKTTDVVGATGNSPVAVV